MNAMKTPKARSVMLRGQTAEELMTASPVSLREDLLVREAITFLVDRNISGAPVIDFAGRPVGVLTQSDILVHDREEVEHVKPQEMEYGSPLPRSYWDEFEIERVDTTTVREIMTPAVFCLNVRTPAWKVIEQMRDLHVHRLFVVDDDGVMVGVITAMDIVRDLEIGERD